MSIFGQISVGLGIVFIVLGLVDFALEEIWEPRPMGIDSQYSPGGIVGIILALSKLARVLSGAPAYITATILGVLLIFVGSLLIKVPRS
jgi:hypothetical protein